MRGAEFGRQQIVRSNGVDLCAQTFGDRADPAVLLIAGNSASMLSWEDDFCARLASAPRFVIRYDHRDTGRSVTYAPGAPEYTLQDLAVDAVGLLDAFGLARAHLVGMSMGGAIAQLVVLDHPDRIASLPLIATSSVSPLRPDRPSSRAPPNSAGPSAGPGPVCRLGSQIGGQAGLTVSMPLIGISNSERNMIPFNSQGLPSR
jgi:pimeloyl-ACP methyl ester carboxylesterase